jgi:hypothetical protein
MTTLELRAKLHKAIDNAPEKLLPVILDHINHIQQTSPSKEELKKFIDKVFQEDDGLLRRLAE